MNDGSVLLVEDDIFLAENIAHILAPLRVSTTIATSRREALDRTREQSFDIGIIDVYLPDGEGIELVPTLKERCPSSELIIVTGRATIDAATQAVRAGAVDFLVKPFTSEQLRRAVGAALSRRDGHHRALRDERIAAVCSLATGLAHHLRNPLNAALLQLAVAERQATGTASDHLRRADAELRRLARILSDFEACLDSRAPCDPEPVSVAALWTSVLEQAQPPVDVATRATIQPGLTVHVERERFSLALFHLVRNAIEAMSGRGTLTFRAHTSPQGIQLEVEDDGPGIEDAQRVFDPFHTTKDFGTGLGLSIVYRTVMEHGGTIRVESRPGRTTFVIELQRKSAVS